MKDTIRFLSEKQSESMRDPGVMYRPAMPLFGNTMGHISSSFQKTTTSGCVGCSETGTKGVSVTKGQAVFPPGSGRVVTRGQDIGGVKMDYLEEYKKWLVAGFGLSTAFILVAVVHTVLQKHL